MKLAAVDSCKREDVRTCHYPREPGYKTLV